MPCYFDPRCASFVGTTGFGLSDGFWTGLQTDYDTAGARDALADELARIHPLQTAAEPRRVG